MVKNQNEFNNQFPKEKQDPEIKIEDEDFEEKQLLIKDYPNLENLRLKDIESIETLILQNLSNLQTVTI